MVVDGVFHTEEIVIKPLSSKLRHLTVFSGTTILGDGTVIMIIDPNGIAQALGRVAPQDEQIESGEAEAVVERRSDAAAGVSRRLAATESRAAVARSPASRRSTAAGSRPPTASIWCNIAISSCRSLRVDGGKLKQDGAVPILVFSDHGRRMGLIVDEIIDIVEQRLDIEVASERPGLVGYAVVKGSATEIVDIAHFLPQAYDDWFHRRDLKTAPALRRMLLVDDSAVLPRHAVAADQGRRLSGDSAASAAEALAAIRSETRIDLVITDIEMPDMDGFELAAALRHDPATAGIPVIALSAMVSTDAIERGRRVGFHDFVAKFDRTGLIAAIKEQTEDLHRGGVSRRRRDSRCTTIPTSPSSSRSPSPDRLFGVPIWRVQDVFKPSRITRVPLAGAEIAGVFNLRGRIVTAIDMRRRLEANRRERRSLRSWRSASKRAASSFGLLVDAVGEVLKLPNVERERSSDQSRRQARRLVRRRLPARRPAARCARCRPRSRPARRADGGVGKMSVTIRENAKADHRGGRVRRSVEW